MTLFNPNFSIAIKGRVVLASAAIGLINPAAEMVFARVPEISEKLVGEAVAAARRAFSGWSQKLFGQRRVAVAKVAEMLLANAEFFARFFTQEKSRPAR